MVRLKFPVLPSTTKQFEEACVKARTVKGRDGPFRDAQLQQLQGIWQDAVEDVPYYAGLVERGLAPQRLTSWADFFTIPELDRAVIQQRSTEFVRRSGAPDFYLTTGGSTGQPVSLGEWNRTGPVLRVAKLVPWVELGYIPSDTVVLIWGHAHLLGTGSRRLVNHAVRRIKDTLLRYIRVDAYSLNPDKAAQIARMIVRERPSALIGYTSFLDLLCRYVPSMHAELRDVGLKFVMPAAEPPPRADTFDLLRATFGCPLLQEFGGVDFGHVAFKIDSSPYVIFHELNLLEVDAALGEREGPALVTSLYRRYVPLIRYRQGDTLSGVERDPDNGLVLTFAEQAGRVSDMVTMPDGTSVHSVALTHCFKDHACVLNVQMVLADEGYHFELVQSSPLEQATEEAIRHKLSQVHHSLKDTPLKRVDDLSLTRAGKRRWFIDKRSRDPTLGA